MKKMFFVVLFVALTFIANSAFACQDWFCETLNSQAGIDLEIGQSQGSFQDFVLNTGEASSMGYQSIRADGYASPGAMSRFEAKALQNQNYDESYQNRGGKEVGFAGYSLMESKASGSATPNCDLDFVSTVGQNSRSGATVHSAGSGSYLDMSTSANVSGTGRDLNFTGNYEQAHGVYTSSQNSFTLSEGFTQVKINQ